MGTGPSAMRRRGPLLVGGDGDSYENYQTTASYAYHYTGYDYTNENTYRNRNENNSTYRRKKDNHRPCGFFSLFCPPGKSRDKDPLGSPLPPTPRISQPGTINTARQKSKRSSVRTRTSSRYDGLEVENNTNGNGYHPSHPAKHSYPNDGFFDDEPAAPGQNGHPNLNVNGHHHQNYHNKQFYYNNHRPTQEVPFIYDGPDGEQKFMKKYQMSEVLGVGSTSICHRCVDRNTGKSYACKIIDKQQIEARFEGMLSQFHTEIAALQKLSTHPNIIQLYDVYTTQWKIYIVMELMAGGELFDYVVQKGTLTEAEASAIVRMVTSALVYMHDQNIIHRDLKPENLLLTHKPNSIYDIEVKIIDFGLSKSMSEPLATTFLGTRGYLAPEMLQRRNYSKAVDTWALGVIVFVLLCGCLPFDDDSTSIPSDDLIRSKFTLRFPRWARNLSPSAKDLLSHLLDVNPASRYSAEDAMDHPWVRGQTAPKDSMLHSPGRISLTPSSGGRGVGVGRSGGGYGHGGLSGSGSGHRRRRSNGGAGGVMGIVDHKNHGTRGGGGGPRRRTTTEDRAAANRSQMNQMIANRARANSLPRQYRQFVRKKSI